MSYSRTILTESVWRGLNEDTQSYLTEWDSVIPLFEKAGPLFESELSQQQIQQLFQNAEKYAIGSGEFKTASGKVGSAVTGGVKLAANTVSQIDAKVKELGKAIQDSTPVQGIDAAFEKAKKDVFVKLGGEDSKVNQLILQMGQLAKDHPGKTKFLIGALTTAAALAGGPSGGAAAGYLLRSSLDLLKGEKLSTAAGKAIKTAAYGAIAGWALQGIGDWLEGFRADVVPYEKAPGLVSIDVDMKNSFKSPYGYMNREIGSMTIPEDRLGEFQDIIKSMDNAIADGDGSHPMVTDSFNTLWDFTKSFDRGQFLRNMNLQNDLAQQIAQDNDAFLQNMKAINDTIAAVAQGTVTGKMSPSDIEVGGKPLSKEEPGAKKQNTKESINYDLLYTKHMAGIPLTESEQQLVNEIGWDNIKKGAGKAVGAVKTAAGSAASAVGSAAGSVGKELGQKVTSRKLEKLWSQAGKPTDTATVLKILTDAGLDSQVILDVAKASDVEVPAGAIQPPPGDTQKRSGPVSGIGKAIDGAEQPTQAKAKAAENGYQIAQRVKSELNKLYKIDPVVYNDLVKSLQNKTGQEKSNTLGGSEYTSAQPAAEKVTESAKRSERLNKLLARY